MNELLRRSGRPSRSGIWCFCFLEGDGKIDETDESMEEKTKLNHICNNSNIKEEKGNEIYLYFLNSHIKTALVILPASLTASQPSSPTPPFLHSAPPSP
jgi:hypothetical protein